ncbi:MAG: RdgB/HAM1 family non-canonical purine NTP pyrophosphatase [Corynebacterium sp.]|uniref:RdgB/HAM1 family non-canonical purine NTP pyrophosphatase n=1 Tax=Corynebacterium sp. TaxID=1720 RepID=UPI0026DA75E2|nr:RdgB/HAM1 family non-canonical purine NTP pyrophosphatase [Corynebacterium sp.]MDO5099237.1 RdgB/HAM1 family non-canonical purine NTP pyrophosphatase [Corynebacterium sp.]
MEILLASNNAKKARELETILAEFGLSGVQVVLLRDAPEYAEPVEDGRTFADNALIKARAGVSNTGMITIADDSGLSVEELNGCPGVLSARWAGNHGDDAANNSLLLEQMAHVPDERRQAAFVSVCALIFPNGEEYLAEGRWDGWLLREPRGENGFGYDPLFVPNEEVESGTMRSSAQLSPNEKNAVSHRRKALLQLAPIIGQHL